MNAHLIADTPLPVSTGSSPLAAATPTRRNFLAGSAALVAGVLGARQLLGPHPLRAAERETPAADRGRALVAITLDLEMSRNFPTWETVHWDYEKGNLNEQTKQYTSEACRRVRAHGGVVHSFVVGRVLEQEDVSWLKEIAAAGHLLGNHTYDHVNILARKLGDLQLRFRRAPWLVAGRPPAEVIAENIRLTNLALRERIGVDVCGFRSPGGFAQGLTDRLDVQAILQSVGFTWVSCRYAGHFIAAGQPASADVLAAIVAAQRDCQPFTYASGLVEVPMSPITDIGAFRIGRWKLADFVRAVEGGVRWAIEHRAVYDFVAHPSCMYVMDPEFKAIERICQLVGEAGDKAAIVGVDTLAQRARPGA